MTLQTTEHQNAIATNLTEVTSGFRPSSSPDHDASYYIDSENEVCLEPTHLGPLDGLPLELIEEIASFLDHADYLNLRSTCGRLRDALPSLKILVEDAFQLDEEQAERALARVNRTIADQLKAPHARSSIISALQNIEISGSPNGIVLAVTYDVHQEGQNQRLQGLIEKFSDTLMDSGYGGGYRPLQ